MSACVFLSVCLSLSLFICLCVCAHEYKQEPEEGVRTHGAGVTDRSEQSSVSAILLKCLSWCDQTVVGKEKAEKHERE